MEKSKLIKTIKAAQDGDESAMSRLYVEYAGYVYRLAFKLTGSKEEAEDVMQNVFMVVLRKISELRNLEAFEGWLRKITLNSSVAALKKRINTASDGEDILGMREETEVRSLPERALDGKETLRIIGETVDALPAVQRICVYYHYYQGLTAPKIAELINENINTVKSRIARAKKKIRSELKRIEKEEGIKLRGVTFMPIASALKLSVDSVDVPASVIQSVWSEIAAASAESIAKTAAKITVGTAATSVAGSAGLKLAALLGAIFLTVGVGVGIYFGTDLLREVTPMPIINEYNPNINYYGNSAGNIVNHGIAALQGDWIYYTGSEKGIYKIKTDGTGNVLLTNDEALYLNVAGDWLYYRNNSDDYKLYKIRTDGSEKTMLDEFYISMTDEGSYINVVGDWVYYMSNNLYKIRTDGTEKTKVNYDYTNEIKVVDDWVFYSNHGESYKLYKIRTDGTEKTKLNDDLTRSINVVGDWIYYSNGDDDYKMYKIRTDGTERVKINDDSNHNINIVDDWIYYGNSTDGGKIYKTHVDGTQNTKLNDYDSYNINIVGDWIYYRNQSEDNKIYKMKLDGTENKPIEENASVTDGIGLSAYDLLGYEIEDDGDIVLSVDFDDPYVFDPDKFRELFFGTWEHDGEVTRIDDSEDIDISRWFVSGEIASKNVKGEVYYTLLINGGVPTVYWIDVNEPDVMYVNDGLYAGTNRTFFQYETWTRASASVTEPAEDFFNDMRLKEFAIERGINPDMLIEIDTDWGVRNGTENAGWCFPSYLISEEDEKIVIKTYVRETLGDEGVEITYTLQKTDGEWVQTLYRPMPETFEYLGEIFSVEDADDAYYNDGGLAEMSFYDFGYINTDEGVMKIALGQEVDGLTATTASVTFGMDYNGNILVTDTDIIFEGELELTGRLYKVRSSIAEPAGFEITEPTDGIIPFGTYYTQFINVWGDYNPEDEYPDIFAESDYREVRAKFGAVRLRVTSRSTGGDFIELTGISEIIG